MFSLVLNFVFVYSLVESAIDVIGNYKQLNPKNCGVSRLTPEMDAKCFEWHKELLPSLKNARNVTIGEAPWMALIVSNKTVNGFKTMGLCGGALIADQWILTAAHCLQNIKIETQIEIYFGYDFQYNSSNKSDFKSKEWYIHPNYSDSTRYFQQYDIALIKLNKPINTTIYGIKSKNNICLPEMRNHYKRGQVEYGMLAGWSTFPKGNITNLEELSARLQISYWRIDTNHGHLSEKGILYVEKLDNQLPCKGDSGSPLWQYHMGRAVLIGVLSTTSINNKTMCSFEHYLNSVGLNTTAVPIIVSSVSTKMDWIMNVTELT